MEAVSVFPRPYPFKGAEVINVTFRLLTGIYFQLWPDNLLKSHCQTLLLGDEERKKDPEHERPDLLEVLQSNVCVCV